MARNSRSRWSKHLNYIGMINTKSRWCRARCLPNCSILSAVREQVRFSRPRNHLVGCMIYWSATSISFRRPWRQERLCHCTFYAIPAKTLPSTCSDVNFTSNSTSWFDWRPGCGSLISYGSIFYDERDTGECHEKDLKTLRGLVLTNADCPLTDFIQPPWSEAVLVTPRHPVRMKWNSMTAQSKTHGLGLALIKWT